MHRIARGLLLVVVTIATLLPWRNVEAQSGGRYFPETGHTLEPQFVAFFDQNGGIDIFGFPITDGFTDPVSGRWIQYTENARLEWFEGPEGGDGRVALRPLGEIMGGWHPPDSSALSEGGGCRRFDESGHATCYSFLEFFQAHGGRDLFGVPISGFIIENDRIVQYFEYFRLDWYPEAALANQVRVAPLGRQHFRREGYDPALLRPSDRTDDQPYRITELRPSASVLHPSVPPTGEQQIYLVVRDQNLLPVEGAAILLVAHLPSRDRYFLMPPTDSQGVSRMTLTLREPTAGANANLEIWVMHAGLEVVARDSFAIR